MATVKSSAKLLLNGQPIANKKLKAKDLINLVSGTQETVKQKSISEIESLVSNIAKYYEKLVKEAIILPSVELVLENLFYSTIRRVGPRTGGRKEMEFFTKIDPLGVNSPAPEMMKYPGLKTNIELFGTLSKNRLVVTSESDYPGLPLKLGQMAINNLSELIDERQEQLNKIAVLKMANKMKNYTSAIFSIKGTYRGRGFYVFRRLYYYTNLNLDSIIQTVINFNNQSVGTRIIYHPPRGKMNETNNTLLSQKVTILISFNMELFSSDIVQENLINLYKTKIDVMQRYNYIQPNYAAGETVSEILKINSPNGGWNVFTETGNTY